MIYGTSGYHVSAEVIFPFPEFSFPSTCRIFYSIATPATSVELLCKIQPTSSYSFFLVLVGHFIPTSFPKWMIFASLHFSIFFFSLQIFSSDPLQLRSSP